MSSKKKINHRHYVCVLIMAAIVAWSCFICKNSYIRLFWTVVDFGLSFVYALLFIYPWCPAPMNVNSIPGVDVTSYFPQTWESLLERTGAFFTLFFSKDNFSNFLVEKTPQIQFFARLLMILCVLYCLLLLIRYIKKPHQNTKHGEYTKAWYAWRKLEDKLFLPVIRYVRSVIDFFLDHGWYCYTALVIFLASTNLFTIAFGIIGYYFYFLGSFDFTSIVYQLYKLSVDLIILYSALPWQVWLCIGAVIFDKLTKHLAYKKLNKLVKAVKAFLRELGIVIFITGLMRSGKTSLSTELMEVQAIIFREDSEGVLLHMQRHFPDFPWKVYQQELLSEMKARNIKSLASAELYVEAKKKAFLESPELAKIFGYEYKRYAYKYDNGLIVTDIWKALEVYAMAFLIYTEPTYYVATYSVRENHEIETVGNYPRWDMEIFKRDSFDPEKEGEYSHILNWDYVRPGKKMKPDENVFGTIEYGILGFPELDKERENNLELQEVKKSDENANQRNDLFNKWLKMCGHGSNVDYITFLRCFGDSQRAFSWGADGRELSDHLHISDESELRLALPFFNWRYIIYFLVKPFYNDKVLDDWYNRGDRTLRAYLLDKTIGRYMNYVERIENTFGYKIVTVLRGDEGEELTKHKIAKCNKMVYSGKYDTASFSDWFRQNNLVADKALKDVERYTSLTPSLKVCEEKQNSYLMNSFTENNKKTPGKSRKNNEGTYDTVRKHSRVSYRTGGSRKFKTND